jgi:hypothetical protein
VGDDGAKNVEDIETQLQKESEHMFTLWWATAWSNLFQNYLNS